LVGAKLAADTTNPALSLGIETDSRYVLNALKNGQKFENEGFITTSNKSLIASVLTSFRTRTTPTYTKWVKGHDGNERNEGADKLAKEALSKDKASFVNLLQPPNLKVTGAKLTSMTQSLAYKAIMQMKTRKNGTKRKRTELNLMRIQNCVEDRFGYIPTKERFWESIRHKDFDRKTRDFLWMTCHDAYWTGTHWSRPNMPVDLQERAICSHCGVIDDLTHILTTCEATGQEIIWSLAENLWKRKKSTLAWFKPTLGDILGCSLAKITNPKNGKPVTGENRLWRIIIAESAHLIWTTRCQRVITNEGRHPSKSELQNKWTKMMNDRLELDCRLTNLKLGTKAIPKKLVLRTWKGTLTNEEKLPNDWTAKSGGLVGIAVEREEEGFG
ncbi:hypothetical protein F5050DRAFT_1571392, partial [Lentinula boryana]